MKQNHWNLDNPDKIGNKKSMRIMGLDVGSHTIGIAISDELRLTAQGLKTIRRKSMEDDLREIATVIDQFGIDTIVVGTLGKQAENVLRWIDVLKDQTKLPVATWDERLSTVGANKVLLEADLSRRKRRKVIDKLAAVLILQGYLDQGRRPNHGTLSQE
jgi:putative Holliday junction resolvase